MNRNDIAIENNGNNHFLGFALARPLQHGNSHWLITSQEYQLHVLDYYDGQLRLINGVERADVESQNVRVWLSDTATTNHDRDVITEKVLRILMTA